MEATPQWFDRDLQRHLLQLLVGAYPHALTPQQMGHAAGDRKLVGNLAYLAEHGLVEAMFMAGTHGRFVGGAVATVKGAEFLHPVGPASGGVSLGDSSPAATGGQAVACQEAERLRPEQSVRVQDKVRLSLSEDGRGHVEIHSLATDTALLLPLADVDLLREGLMTLHRTASSPETVSLDPTS